MNCDNDYRSAQRQALAAGGGFGKKKPKVENA